MSVQTLTIRCPECNCKVELRYLERDLGEGYPVLGGSHVWECWPALERAEYIRTVHRGPSCYGHVDLYVDPWRLCPDCDPEHGFRCDVHFTEPSYSAQTSEFGH